MDISCQKRSLHLRSLWPTTRYQMYNEGKPPIRTEANRPQLDETIDATFGQNPNQNKKVLKLLKITSFDRQNVIVFSN